MADTTQINDIPYPVLEDDPSIMEVTKPLAEHIDDKINSRFSTTTERDTRITAPLPPIEGQECWVDGIGKMIYNGTSWVPFPGTVIFHAYQGSTVNLVNNAVTAMPLSAITIDLFSTGLTTGTGYTTPFAGTFKINGAVSYAANATGVRSCLILANGAQQVASNTTTAATAASMILLTRPVYLNLAAGVKIEVAYFQNTGAAMFNATGISAASLAVAMA
jgi:hypothetical protein